MKLTRKLIFTALLATAAGATGAFGQTLNWGNTINPEIDGMGDPLAGYQEMSFDSTGVAIDDTGSTFTFEIGAFADGFVPTASNVDLWHLKWSDLQGAAYVSELNYFTGSYSLTAGDSGLATERAYIWVYDNDIATSTSEWFLVTGDTETGATPEAATDANWRIPTFGGAGGTFDWRLSTANHAVWGGLNNDGNPGVDGPNESFGDGIQNVDPGVYELQTHAVPEPSSFLLALSGMALGFRRRRGAGARN